MDRLISGECNGDSQFAYFKRQKIDKEKLERYQFGERRKGLLRFS
jgi:hypothetical protein